MRNSARTCLFAGAIMLACGAHAQDEPKTSGSEIVVTGMRNTDDEVADFVAALTEAPVRGQLSRFEGAVCPAAAGLSPSQKVAVTGRLRRVAEAAGLRAAAATCAPNVVLLITGDKRALIETLQRKYPAYFDGMSSSEMRRLAQSPGPAAAWHLQGPPRTANGLDLSPDAYHGKAGFYTNRTSGAASRIVPAAYPQFAVAVVVVDAKALPGLTTTQLADYAAMRSLMRTDPERLASSSTPTILKVLDAPADSQVPASLTRWDLGMLRAFYASSAKTYAASQRTEIRKRLSKELRDGDERPN